MIDNGLVEGVFDAIELVGVYRRGKETMLETGNAFFVGDVMVDSVWMKDVVLLAGERHGKMGEEG